MKTIIVAALALAGCLADPADLGTTEQSMICGQVCSACRYDCAVEYRSCVRLSDGTSQELRNCAISNNMCNEVCSWYDNQD